MNNENKIFISNTIAVYCMRIASYVFPLLTTPFLTRVLLENNYGLYAWANAVMNYARLVVDYGFVLYGVEAIARCGQDNLKIGRIIYLITLYKTLLAFVTAIVLVIITGMVPDFRDNYLLLVISFIPVAISVFNLDYVFQGIEKMKYITTRVVITKFVFTLFVFLFIRNPEQYVIIPVFTAIGDLLSVILMWRNLYKDCKLRPIKSPVREGWDLARKSSWFFLSRICAAVYSSGNLVLLGIICSPSQVGEYSIAYTIIVVLQNLITPLADSAYPYMVKHKNFAMIKKIVFLFEPLIISCCLIAYFVSPYIIPFVFGNQYQDAPSIFRLLLPIIVITLPQCMFGFPVLSALGKYKETNIAIVNASILHIMLSLMLVITHNYNVFTVAIITSIAEIFITTRRSYLVYSHFYKKYE